MGDQLRKQAACIPCRRSKVKCQWQPDQRRCRRCAQAGSECIRGEYHAGRQKGTKNKRVGLDKALYQIEQAVRRTRSTHSPADEDGQVLDRLRKLLNSTGSNDGSPSKATEGQISDEEEISSDDVGDAHPPRISNDRDPIESAESPLQLLAASHRHSKRANGVAQSSDASRLRTFFAPAHVSLDVGEDVDPINLGLVSDEEAESLFTFFHTNLAHTRWGLDSRIYNMTFTRSRSAFLFTSVMAASALFIPTAGALSKRLSNHVKVTALNVIQSRHKSVEIVLAFMVNIPWMFPGEQSTDDETAFYISTAETIAIDLSLHKSLVPTKILKSASGLTLSRGECLDTKTALSMDGFSDVDPESFHGRLLLRSRERCWISLFNLERGMCLARGRPFTIPSTRLIRDCNGWHQSDLADAQDGHVLSMAVLRRDLDGLLSNVRALCDGSQIISSSGTQLAQSIHDSIEHFFNQWHAQWHSSVCLTQSQQLPPYVEIILTHTRLSIYGGLINHPTAPLEVRQFFRTAGLSSALNVMRAAIQGEARLSSMPNNTAIMISFAACFALTLSAYVSGNATLAPSIRELIDQTASVLERIGNVTPHRNGASVLYGMQLRQILKDRGNPNAQTDAGPAVGPTAVVPDTLPTTHSHNAAIQQPLEWPDMLQFSTMSDLEIAQVLNEPGIGFEPYFEGMSWDDLNGFDWLHWPESI